MKKKLFIFLSVAVMLVCAFAVSASAATPDESREKVTLTDGTQLPIWDKDGSGLIWYINGTDSETGKSTYACVSNLNCDSSQNVYIKYTSYTGNTNVNFYLKDMSIVDNGTTYAKTAIVVANLQYTDENPLYLPNQNVPFNALYDSLFKSCTNLEYIFVPKQLIKINPTVFNGCTRLQCCDLSYTNVKTIEGAAFQGATSLKWVSLPSCFEEFANSKNFFNGCTALERVDGINEYFERLAKNNGTIPNSLFYGCTNLSMEIILPEGITKIDELAFFQCSKLNFETLVIPNSVTTIARSAFNSCTQIKTVKLGASVTTLGDKLFRGCTGIKEIYIPASLSAMSAETCYSLPKDCVFYYTGTQDQLTTLISASSTSGNGAFINATVKSLSEYNNLETKSGRYIVYGVNKCDAFYGSAHSFDNDCTTADVCKNACGAIASKADSHNYDKTLEFPNGFANSGILTVGCQNPNCASATDSEVNAIFAAKGYSTNPEQNAINGGYAVNLDSLALYKEINGEIKYGIVIANAKSFDGEFFDENNKVNSTKALQVEIDSQYSNFDCSISFGANTGVELDLVICAYVITDDGVVFIQKDSGSDVTIGGATFKSVTLASVVALVPAPASKEN